MFGHDNQNNQNQHDNSVTPAISPAPDDLVNDQSATQATSAPAFDTSSVSLGGSQSAPVADEPADAPTTASEPAQADNGDHLLTANGDDNLLHIKQDALQQLSPLVGHLEQTPEEKFRTTMMMIQASDDQSLVKSAYDAAKEIKDDKVRAQALLDIINEINYFTQQQQES